MCTMHPHVSAEKLDMGRRANTGVTLHKKRSMEAVEDPPVSASRGTQQGRREREEADIPREASPAIARTGV
jgi:hypothetical protein